MDSDQGRIREKTGARGECGSAVSEVIGTIILISIVVLVVATIAVLFLSHNTASEIPHLEAIISYDSSHHTVIFYHNGGDPLPGPVRSLSVIDPEGNRIPNTSDLMVYNQDGSVESSGTWSLGRYILYPIDPSAGTPFGAQVIFTGVTQALIASAQFTTGYPAPPTGPTLSPTTTATATTLSTTITTPTTVPTTPGTLHTSSLAVAVTGSINPVTVQYTSNKAGSGSRTAPYTISWSDAANSSFQGTLTAPLQDCSGSSCGSATHYFNQWVVNGIASSEPSVTFAVPDNSSWTATAIYSTSLPCHCISGKVWEDYNMNGVIDTGEPALQGWTTSLYRRDGNSDTFIGSTITDTAGEYLFFDIPYTDQYTIREVLKSGWEQSYPSKGYYEKVVLNPGSKCNAYNLHFGNREVLTANFSGSPTSGPAPLVVQFTDSSTDTPQSWSWNFGDGYTSTQQDPVHTYMAAGTYGVTLSVANSWGQAHQLQKAGYITVTSPLATRDILLNAAKGGYVAAGGIIQFRVTGSNSYVQVGSTRYLLNLSDVVRMAVRSDSTGTIFITSAPGLTSFSFPDVDLSINGSGKKSGSVSSIYISSFDQYTSSLTLVVPRQSGWISLTADGATVLYGIDENPVTVRNLRPDPSFNSLNLDLSAYHVWYTGGAVGYSLS